MNIVMLSGSPHKNGTTSLLADRFVEGAELKGHTVTRFDLGSANLHPCHACDYCVRNGTVCVQKDAMEGIRPAILAADLVVLVSPMYYFGFCSQLKIAIDRFYAFNDALLASPKKAALLAVCGDDEDWVDGAMLEHYRTICRYLGWESVGEIMARGYYRREDIEGTEWPERARRLGESI